MELTMTTDHDIKSGIKRVLIYHFCSSKEKKLLKKKKKREKGKII